MQYIPFMPTKGAAHAIRFNEEDLAILAKLQKKLGLGTATLLRLALRRLYGLEFEQKK